MSTVPGGRRIMVTSMGSGVGRAVVQSAQHSWNKYEIFGTTTVPLASPHEATVVCPPTLERAAFRRALIDAVSRWKPRLVLPGRDEDAVALAEFAPTLADLSALVLGGPYEVVRATYDKALTANLLPEGWYARTATDVASGLAIARDSGWPVIIKPRHGFASRRVQLAYDDDQLTRWLGPEDVVQEFLPGDRGRAPQRLGSARLPQFDEYSLQLLLGPRSELLGWFCSRNDLIDGRPAVVEPLPQQDVVDAVMPVVDGLAKRGATGPWNLQGRRSPSGEWRFFEVNARLTGMSGLRAHLGFNEVDLLYDAFVEGSREAATTYRIELVVDATPWTHPTPSSHHTGGAE